MRIGTFPDLPIEQARKAAARLRRDRLRQEPRRRAAVGARRNDPSRIVEVYLERHAKPRKKASTVTFNEWQWGKYLPAWKDRKLSSIRHRDLQKLNVEIGRDHGPAAANAPASAPPHHVHLRL